MYVVRLPVNIKIYSWILSKIFLPALQADTTVFTAYPAWSKAWFTSFGCISVAEEEYRQICRIHSTIFQCAEEQLNSRQHLSVEYKGIEPTWRCEFLYNLNIHYLGSLHDQLNILFQIFFSNSLDSTICCYFGKVRSLWKVSLFDFSFLGRVHNINSLNLEKITVLLYLYFQWVHSHCALSK